MARLEEYPYRLWANGEWHRLAKGQEYQIKTTSIRIMLANYAKENGKSLQTRKIEPDVIEVRMIDGDPRCQHCEEPFTKRGSAQKFCEACLPIGDSSAKHRFDTYKMPDSEYQRRLAALPDGLCPICQLWKATSVDHDHNCCPQKRTRGDCNRGILCGGCNLNLEQYDNGLIDLPDIPESARTYLASYTPNVGNRNIRVVVYDGYGTDIGLITKRVRPTRS